ncbi:Asp-tRNA(Asn)/Glu-tRNA(Gln) amidotransferase C subunit [Mycoplasmoides fastidiosum]|uniref:Asp-tRNA(Asn)/Glu-tRNA(Gln) amidotransferase C subunit n=1 Tax=Mycoplasmoides fastidiosum TaxID=92758 RepID=A0ABU0LZE0_9BACT|nr:hypothetical protein [Mycoplasmoides fastidiosum]MDQ0514072.1 Asp-tRNA(Asn)/Glu-tRNA(Gln) amidotransferase C subunit [Mycoplasmoides fastidiosum]UUD37518.1 hypothetical protein NPA10_03030 [Mycoplasmoides fastidiosum]
MKIEKNQITSLTKNWYIPLDESTVEQLITHWNQIDADLSLVTTIATEHVVISNSLKWISNTSLATDQPQAAINVNQALQTVPNQEEGYVVVRNEF